MKTWIALLRGINVGGRHIIPMKELREMLTRAGFTDVRTYIQSGNVVLRHLERPEGRIGDLIEAQYGFRPWVLLMSLKELEQAAAASPYPKDAGKFVHFFFGDRDPVSIDTELLDSLRSDTESYAIKGRVFYLHAPDGIGRSKLVDKIGKALPGVTLTARNLNTINKLLELAAE